VNVPPVDGETLGLVLLLGDTDELGETLGESDEDGLTLELGETEGLELDDGDTDELGDTDGLTLELPAAAEPLTSTAIPFISTVPVWSVMP
jgi:hypothetical protein